jgi:hypothetical protein
VSVTGSGTEMGASIPSGSGDRGESAAASWCDGWKVGERVCVHGKGFGRIVRLVDREVHPYAVVEIPRLDVHEPSAQKISWTDTVTVSLDVYPAHMSRSAA